MKAVVLCGGVGSRLAEETEVKPKPMVEVGGYPILWHILKGFAASGFREFVLALGYKGDVIKEYFLGYRHRSHGLTINLRRGSVEVHEPEGGEDWIIHLVDTGTGTQTGGRVKKAIEFMGRETFLMTYGDGVSNVDLRELVRLHKAQGTLATVTAVRPPSRFGGIVFDGDKVGSFEEKPQIGEGWINGGFFVLDPRVAEYVDDDSTVFERGPMERLARERQLAAYRHEGFWACMDTLRDVKMLNSLWQEGAPWKTW